MSPDAAPLLKAENLRYATSGRDLVKGVNLVVRAGEIIVILGRNGAGKSTLLNLVTGEFPPADGRIEVFGRELSSYDLKALSKRRAVLTQTTALTFDYSVLEVVLLGRLPHEDYGSAAADREIARRCLREVGLETFAERGYLSLSGGEQQRVHLARILAQIDAGSGARLVFLDEPTSSLDLKHQHQTLRLMQGLKATGVGVVVVLHDLNLAAQYADRILILKEGRAAAWGTPDEVLTEDKLTDAYDHPVRVLRHPDKNCPLIV